MKKVILVMMAVLALACNKENGPKTEDSIKFASSKEFRVGNSAENVNLSFTASADWTSSNSFAWLTLSPSSGVKGAAAPVLSVDNNPDRSVRKGYVVIKSGTVQDTVRVIQEGAKYLTVEPGLFNVGVNGGTYICKVSANLDYTMKLEPETASEWIATNLPAPNAKGESNLIITVAGNNDVHARTARITFISSAMSAEISVNQSALAPVFTVETAASVSCPASGKSFSVPVTTNLEITASTPSWITATRTDTGFNFEVSPNSTDALRSGTVTISNTEFNKKASFSVSQKSTKSLYILAIGNSFSDDAMEYLYPILQELGYKDIFLGNLYIGGCTLQTHAGNVTNNLGAYEYRTNSQGTWSTKASFSAITALKEREWDYVSMQQASGYSGLADSYEPYLSTIVNKVKELCPGAKRMWHMTWAYQANSGHSDFPKYNRDQMTMYNGILDAVRTKVLSRGDFDFVIPSGTAVQNLRTSYMGDKYLYTYHITRDGYHMSYKNGRFLTALMWARQITGKSIADISYRPKPSDYTYSSDDITVIKDAVEKAYNHPYEVTESVIPPTVSYVLPSEELKNIFTGAGYNLDEYDCLPLIIENYAYYNSTAVSTAASVMKSKDGGSTDGNLVQFAGTQILEKKDIPNGSVIVLKQGFQYRPEGWRALTTVNTSSDRPANVSASSANSVVVVNDAWWGSWNYRAFNLAKSGNPNLDASGQQTLRSCFAIFVPKQ